MNAHKKSNIHQFPHRAHSASATNSSSDRNIVVYYYTDATKRFVISGTTRWYKYARSAKSMAHDAMVNNLYGAGVAVVHDDSIGKDLFIFVRHSDNNVETAWNANTMHERYSGTSRDPSGEFTRKLMRSAKLRKTFEMVTPFGEKE